MDSMRHLSTSLPRGRNEPTTDLLSDFKAAALSVTNLYKTAAKSQDRARAAGYQDALDDLLTFLDKESLGLMDGEGWRVRQWATERLDGDGSAPRQGTGPNSTMAEDEDDGSTTKDDDKEEERSSSPEVQRRPQAVTTVSSDLTEEDSQHRRVVSEPPQPAPLQSEFTFQSNHAYPTSNHDRDGNNSMELDSSTTPLQPSITSSTPSSTETVRIVSRPQRNKQHNSRRNDSRIPTLNFSLGSGAGNKRKMPYQDFFDISNINTDNSDRKDGGGGGNGRGGKRGRHV
ncbi:hypothetical protein M409DRAFT_20362 [Zasmidium cellare ATCC 36951]|uniref:Uncharacterized protein n=1 Tax=Zasmidium cellare ATCC 36951 TaxID=1080233 RepID=A0A6A6CPU9_ZASCE|nr:uncharacterized protein M409DRAFT_20362 [Zasmidium cellare ATCC 36951]KAF2169135.1 hypothetical protein M409DRAFT_20362 [Zasmidium cellare ATCC 36951]